MSDWSGKAKPILELIATLSGRSVGIPVFGSGGVPSITDQDIAAGVAMSRNTERKPGRRYDTPIIGCVRPELLLLHWGSRFDMAPQVARACVAGMGRGDARIVRCGSVLAAQSMAGKVLTPEAVNHSAWALDAPPVDLAREVGFASCWMESELHMAERGYCRAMQRWVEPDRARS